ncbi:NAD(P)H-binding protein [Aduncisulcus paluster]|uniref:NAD(P)H-binding protein n=1 Tax=Aduncisulcus paluster TaxID=2918883 RepID=A0ABQ5KW67_9EUKA|nr:NAD(P)H-binding protein [Aduncisulcus paluster]
MFSPRSKFRKVGLFGATGLIGQRVLMNLIDTQTLITVFTHRVLTSDEMLFWSEKPNVSIKFVGDYLKEDNYSRQLRGMDAVFIMVGTTASRAGSKDTQRSIDRDIPIAIASAAKRANVYRIGIVSSTGASVDSKWFFLKMKGEMEKGVEDQRIPFTCFVRPSIVRGKRRSSEPFRYVESASKFVAVGVSWFLPKTIKPVHAEDVAYELINSTFDMHTPGISVVSNSDIISRVLEREKEDKSPKEAMIKECEASSIAIK